MFARIRITTMNALHESSRHPYSLSSLWVTSMASLLDSRVTTTLLCALSTAFDIMFKSYGVFGFPPSIRYLLCLYLFYPRHVESTHLVSISQMMLAPISNKST